MKIKPPKYPLSFFRWFCNPEYVEDLEGDLLERFKKRAREKKPAKWLFALEVLKLFRPEIIKPVSGKKLNYYGMLKHHFKTGWRHLLRKKSFSLINITGLSTGAAVCLLTLIFYRYETSFDHHHKLSNQTYRVVQQTQLPDTELHWGTTAYPLATALRNDFPDFEFVTQTSGPVKRLFSYKRPGGKKVIFDEQYVLFADNFYTQTFDFEWLAGTPGAALKEPNAVVISERIAEKCFGRNYNPSDAIGEILMINDQDQLVVTGVIKNNRPMVNLKSNMIVSYEFFKKQNPYRAGNWSGNYRGTTFVVLDEQKQLTNIKATINDWKGKYLKPEDNERISYALQPLKEIHTETKYGSTPQGYQISRRTLDASLIVAFFILTIAIINFINLVTANASLRSKEVGIRKVIGGGKKVLLSQFITENMILVSIAFFVAIGISYFMLDFINDFLAIINLNLTIHPLDIIVALAFCLLVALFATIYPSILLSSFPPIKALGNKGIGTIKGIRFRKGLTFFQFTIVQVFVIAAIIVGLQLNYFDSKSLGFNSEKIVSVYLPDFDKKDVFSNRLLALGGVSQISIGSGPPMAVENFSLGTRYREPHQPENDGMRAEMKIIDSTYLDLYDIPMIAGRNIRENKRRFDEFIINRKLAGTLKWTPEEAIGKRLTINEGEATIVGVVENFHNQSLQKDLTPVVLMNWQAFQWNAFVKIRSFSTLIEIEEIWKNQFPEKIFNYYIIDDSMEKEYIIEKLIFTGFKFFSILVILIACLGLFGLISFMTHQKTKEIGIRKVLGASVAEVLILFNKQFSFLILLAFIASAPIVWYFMDQWLATFEYSISMNPWMFLGGGLVTFMLGSSVAILKSYKAAITNPVEALKDE